MQIPRASDSLGETRERVGQTRGSELPLRPGPIKASLAPSVNIGFGLAVAKSGLFVG